MFLNGILTNAEIWYGITKSEIKKLEDLDLNLMRKILNTPFSVPSEGVYLELGCMNIETILKARRLNYLHYLLNQNESSMLYKFFCTQWKYSSKNDWTDQARLDLADFGISENLEQIRNQSKNKFKRIAFYNFLERKESHTKLANLFYTEIKLQE